MTINERVNAVEVMMLRADPPVIVEESARVPYVIARMREARAGCAWVTRTGVLVGVFTERDLLLKVLGTPGALDAEVSAYMTRDPQAISENATILKAVSKMLRGEFRNVPIVNDARAVVGCVRHKDIIAYLVEHFADRALNLPPDPDQIPTTRDGA